VEKFSAFSSDRTLAGAGCRTGQFNSDRSAVVSMITLPSDARNKRMKCLMMKLCFVAIESELGLMVVSDTFQTPRKCHVQDDKGFRHWTSFMLACAQLQHGLA